MQLLIYHPILHGRLPRARRSLLEDGADAAKFGLTQKATSSRHEWAKRARNLMGNRNYAMARKAFLQAEDQVGGRTL